MKLLGVCGSLMPRIEQKLRMLLAGGLDFQGKILLKEGKYWQKKKLPWLDLEESVCLMSIILELLRGPGNVTPHELGPCLFVPKPGPTAVPSTFHSHTNAS